MNKPQYHYYQSDTDKLLSEINNDALIADLKKMLLIRNFETRAESAYQQGKIGGFYHAYTGQEAIQTAAMRVMGDQNWWTTTYRCHALALLLGVTPNEAMAELYGKVTGNAKGRGGSMHFYHEKMLGGFGIVGGHIPVAAGAAFALNYLGQENLASICFLGDGAVAQGAFHETLNLASLWDLPCIFVVENNHWGMGTAVSRAISLEPIAESMAPAYKMKSYTLDGMDYFNCYAGFKEIYEEVKKTKRPVIVEVITERFKGHSVSDPGLYRSKEDLKKEMERDPIFLLKNTLILNNCLTEDKFKEYDKEQREIVIQSMKFAEESPFPDPATLEEGVLEE